MSLLTSIVDLESIEVDPTSIPSDLNNKQTEIEALAHAIIELKGGLLRIPVVRSLGIDKYKLVSGHLESRVVRAHYGFYS
jgi:uncharacterized protein (UPF0216 family)